MKRNALLAAAVAVLTILAVATATTARAATLFTDLPEVNDSVGVGIGQRTQQHTVDDAVDRRCGPDPEREGEDGHREEGRRPQEGAGHVANVSSERFHKGKPRGAWFDSTIVEPLALARLQRITCYITARNNGSARVYYGTAFAR